MEILGRRHPWLGWVATVVLVALAMIVGGFSAFAGWNKAFAPLAPAGQRQSVATMNHIRRVRSSPR